MKNDPYRERDAAFQAAGGLEGLRQLTADFYQLMDSRPAFKTIRNLHPDALSRSSEKLALFLSGYFNGPDLYQEKYGPFRLAAFHQHIPIRTVDRDAWLACMQLALDQQPWEPAFKAHVLHRLRTPAERCRNLP